MSRAKHSRIIQSRTDALNRSARSRQRGSNDGGTSMHPTARAPGGRLGASYSAGPALGLGGSVQARSIDEEVNESEQQEPAPVQQGLPLTAQLTAVAREPLEREADANGEAAEDRAQPPHTRPEPQQEEPVQHLLPRWQAQDEEQHEEAGPLQRECAECGAELDGKNAVQVEAELPLIPDTTVQPWEKVETPADEDGDGEVVPAPDTERGGGGAESTQVTEPASESNQPDANAPLIQTGGEPAVGDRTSAEHASQTLPQGEEGTAATTEQNEARADEAETEGEPRAGSDEAEAEGEAGTGGDETEAAGEAGTSGDETEAAGEAGTSGDETEAAGETGPGGDETEAAGDAGVGGDVALIDEELAEHERWAGSFGSMGTAGSDERARFLLDQAGQGAVSGAKGGAVMGLAMGGIGAAVGQIADRRLAAMAISRAGSAKPVPGLGAAIGGVMAVAGLAMRDWGATSETIGRIGTGEGYEGLANDLEGIAEVLDVASSIMDVVAGVLGGIAVGMWVAAVVSAGTLSPLAASLSAVAIGINLASTAVGIIINVVVRPTVTALRALHAFESQGDPAQIEAAGTSLQGAAGQITGAVAGAAAGRAGGRTGGGVGTRVDAGVARIQAGRTGGRPSMSATAGPRPRVHVEVPEAPTRTGVDAGAPPRVAAEGAAPTGIRLGCRNPGL